MTATVPNMSDVASSPDRQLDPVRSRTSSLYMGHVHTRRPVYTQEKFDEGHGLMDTPDMSPAEYIHKRLQRCACSFACLQRIVCAFFPFIVVLSKYSPRRDLAKDVIAGLTVGVMHIPQGMAYGLLSGLPPIYGLYVSFLPPLVYFFFGTSRHISIGTFAVVSLMVGTVVEREPCSEYIRTDENRTALFETELECKIGIATAVTFLAAIFQIGMGVLHMGFVTIYLSEPLTRGLTTGAAVHVLTSQIKYVLGIKSERFRGPLQLIYQFDVFIMLICVIVPRNIDANILQVFSQTYISLFKMIAHINWATVILAVVAMVILFVTKEFINPKVKAKIHAPVPIELIIVILATLVSFLGKLEVNYGMSVVGDIPTGIPGPSMPPMSLLGNFVSDAFSIAIVTFAINVSLAKLFAKKHSYNLDSNQEFIAYGVSNVVGSFFSCFMSAASLSRSLIQEGLGGKTQVATIVSSSLLLFVLFVIGPLFESLPKCALAAVIIVNLKGMFIQVTDLKKLWYISKYDFAVWIVVFLSVVLLDVDMGLLVGFIFCLLTVVFRTQKPYTCILGRVPHTDIYNDINVYEATKEISGIKIFRFEAPLYFANADFFVEKLRKKTGVDTSSMKMDSEAKSRLDKLDSNYAQESFVNMENHDEEQNGRLAEPHEDVRHVIIDCSTMGYIDWTGMNTFSQIQANDEEVTRKKSWVIFKVICNYKQVGVNVYITGCRWNIRRMLQEAGFFEKVDVSCMYVSIHDAVLAAVGGEGQTQPKEPCTSPQPKPLSPGDRWNSGEFANQSGNCLGNNCGDLDRTSAIQDANTKL